MSDETAFRAGLEVAAHFHEERAAFTRARLEHLAANPEMVPSDVRYGLTEDWEESAAQDTCDACYLRAIPLPDSMDAAARAAEEGQRALCKSRCDEMHDRVLLSRKNSEHAREEARKAKSDRDALIALLVEYVPRCCSYPSCDAPATKCSESGGQVCDACALLRTITEWKDVEHADTIRMLPRGRP